MRRTLKFATWKALFELHLGGQKDTGKRIIIVWNTIRKSNQYFYYDEMACREVNFTTIKKAITSERITKRFALAYAQHSQFHTVYLCKTRAWQKNQQHMTQLMKKAVILYARIIKRFITSKHSFIDEKMLKYGSVDVWLHIFQWLK